MKPFNERLTIAYVRLAAIPGSYVRVALIPLLPQRPSTE